MKKKREWEKVTRKRRFSFERPSLVFGSESSCSVCIGGNAAIIVRMKSRNCCFAPASRTMNQLFDSCRHVLPTMAARVSPAATAHIRTRHHYYHSGGSPQFITDLTWHSCMPVPGGHASKPTAGHIASAAACLLQNITGGHFVAVLGNEKFTKCAN